MFIVVSKFILPDKFDRISQPTYLHIYFYVTVRTVDHQRGEIQGQILPTNTRVNCLTTQRFAPPSTEPSPNDTRY
jgi:hypothetical protein